ncbi:hypothetical protein GIB67_026954 [Kingdonia uniflora]|uniref:Stigma-specific Stig1 family protein n=1 Tax=Kingdonia uniflora TaxID=39325 RepID=A0A7J7P1E0_9MAGN|nr:hypothetical protein GIB67_026954 [Kingdonia uniflora]
MKSSMKFFLIIIAIVMSVVSGTLTTTQTDDETETPFAEYDDTLVESTVQSSLLGKNRFLAEKKSRVVMTCDKFPRVCRAAGSNGRDCCKKKCVDVMTDRVNCEMCGRKCRYLEMCCKGECVNPSWDEKNCGQCNNKCKKGDTCVYGMCSYA